MSFVRITILWFIISMIISFSKSKFSCSVLLVVYLNIIYIYYKKISEIMTFTEIKRIDEHYKTCVIITVSILCILLAIHLCTNYNELVIIKILLLLIVLILNLYYGINIILLPNPVLPIFNIFTILQYFTSIIHLKLDKSC
jgi:hypothetical protein